MQTIIKFCKQTYGLNVQQTHLKPSLQGFAPENGANFTYNQVRGLTAVFGGKIRVNNGVYNFVQLCGQIEVK